MDLVAESLALSLDGWNFLTGAGAPEGRKGKDGICDGTGVEGAGFEGTGVEGAGPCAGEAWEGTGTCGIGRKGTGRL